MHTVQTDSQLEKMDIPIPMGVCDRSQVTLYFYPASMEQKYDYNMEQTKEW